MTLLEHFRQSHSEAELTPTEVGFEEIDIPSITEADVVKTYLEYRKTGGRPLKYWEARVDGLQAVGALGPLREGA
jgi:hypothetical protein